MSAALIGIDWGTTNRRAWLLDAQGQVLAEQHDDQGMLACQGRFRASLDAMLQAWPQAGPSVPVIMSGMVGSVNGWQQAPYLDTATPLTQLSQHLMAVNEAPTGRPCVIVPGYCLRAADGRVDVMRGEETQLLGALALGHGEGWYVLPGTHSKWVCLTQGAVSELCTYMTGELFGLLTQHGTLSGMTTPAASVDAPEAFLRGLDAAATGTLSHTLFACRAKVVTGTMPADHARSYLSGLLIGAEWGDALRRSADPLRRVTLIGAPTLAAHYRVAAERFGCELVLVPPEAAQIAALQSLGAGMAPSPSTRSPS